MKRLDLLQHIVNTKGTRNYLEIGVANGTTFFRLKCRRKIAVDPNFAFSSLKKNAWYIVNPYNLRNRFYKMESDTFFKANTKFINSIGGLDLVFVDGMHTFKNSLQDIFNALNCLNTNGIIVVHDCFPPQKEAANHRESYPTIEEKEAQGSGSAWCGDVWKSIHYLILNQSDALNINVLNSDYGLGIISLKRPWQKNQAINHEIFEQIDQMGYQDLVKNPIEIINLIELNDFVIDELI